MNPDPTRLAGAARRIARAFDNFLMDAVKFYSHGSNNHVR